ncbi:hypothetical protein RhiJN_22791 [Ceratobasidium sp. AG-Ba]|nr:hypothetical protein RhiJN_22791 [Ceratobasidium sp. AG-Ba]
MQFLNSIFTAFAIVGNFLPSPPTAGDILTSDPPVTWQATLSRAVIECGSTAGAVVIAALQVSAAEDLIVYTAPVGSFVWRPTSPAVHTWGHHVLRFIVRASIDAHDAMYRGRRGWYSGKGATSGCVFTNVRSRLPRPAILGLPAPPRRLTLPASPRSSVLTLPASVRRSLPTLPAPKPLLSLPPAPPPLPWLVPDMASNTFPIPLSLAPRAPLLTWEVPKNRGDRFLRRVLISDAQVDDSVTERQIWAAVFFVVLCTLLGDLIAFGLDRGYVLYLLNGVGIGCMLLECLLNNDTPEYDDEAETLPDSGDDLCEAASGGFACYTEGPSLASPSGDESNAISVAGSALEMPVNLIDGTDDGSADQLPEPAPPAASCCPAPAIDDGYAESPTSVPTALDSTEAEPATGDHPAEGLSSAQVVESNGSNDGSATGVEGTDDAALGEVLDLANPTGDGELEATPASLANEDRMEHPTAPSEASGDLDLLQTIEVAKQRQIELMAVLEPPRPAPEAPRKVAPVVEPVVSTPAPAPTSAPIDMPASSTRSPREIEPEILPALAADLGPEPEPGPAPEVEQAPAVGGDEAPVKIRTRGVRGGKGKKRRVQQLQSGGTEAAGTEVVGAEAVGTKATGTEAARTVEREPSNSRWFIRQRRQARN